MIPIEREIMLVKNIAIKLNSYFILFNNLI